MRILVAGAGATGGYFGMRLAQAGRDVTFLVRPRRAEQLRARGLRIQGSDGEEQVTPQLVTADEITDTYDLVLFAVKATAMESAVADIAGAVGPETLIAPFLNGIAHIDLLNARFGAARVLGGEIRVATTLDENGDIRQLAPFQQMTIGTQDGARTPAFERVASAMGDAGFDFSVSDEILGAMWAKWSFIATLGALTCLMDGTVGEIVAQPGGREFAVGLLNETAAVAAANGHPVPDRAYAITEQMTTAAGSPLASSMYRDMSAGLATEVEQILGDLTARGHSAGMATPLLDLATLQLRVYEARRGDSA